MTGVQDTNDQKVKRMRRTARALALTWASLASVVLVVLIVRWLTGYKVQDALSRDGFLLVMRHEIYAVVAFSTLLALSTFTWVSIAVAWRRERIGAIMLRLQSFVTIGIAVVATAAMILFLVSSVATPSCMNSPECVSMTALVVVLGVVGVGIAAGMMALPPWALAALFLASWRRSRTPVPPQTTE